MFDAKALRGYTLHTPRGFVIFNEGKVTERIPDEYRARLEAEHVIGQDGEEADNGAAQAGAFTLTDHKFGNYEITGPGLDEPEKVRGKAAAEARLAELEAEHAVGGGTDAPAD